MERGQHEHIRSRTQRLRYLQFRAKKYYYYYITYISQSILHNILYLLFTPKNISSVIFEEDGITQQTKKKC